MDPKVIGAILVSALLVAGCARAPSPAPTHSATTPSSHGTAATPTTTTTTPISEPPSPLNLTLKQSQCRGVLGSGQVPYERISSLVPRGFNSVGLSPETTTVQYHGLACPRTIVGTEIRNNTASFYFSIQVQPMNRSWDLIGLDWYVLDLHTSNLPIPMKLVGHAPAMFVYSNATGVVAWQVKNGTASSYGTEAPISQADVLYRATKQLWFGPSKGPFTRVPVSSHYNIDTASPTVCDLRATGPTRSSAAIGGAVAAICESQHNAEYGWELNEENTYAV